MPMTKFPRILNLAAGAMLLFATAACSSGDDEPEMPGGPTPQIIVMYAPGGLGDQGYNDCILAGVQNFKKEHHDEVEMYQYSPGSVDEAERLLDDWLSLPASDVPALFVVASNDYESMVAGALASRQLTPNKCMLLFESDNPERLPVTTFRLSMYGASYLAGVTASNSLRGSAKDALVLLAHEGDMTIARAADGFRDGFAAYGNKAGVTTEYLADDWSGYASAQIAYQRMSEWSADYGFVFPVAGGSNQGVYRYTRENDNAPLTAGMDVDQSGLSRSIAGCVIKHIDRVVYNYMEEWLSTGSLPGSAVFGLSSGYTDWLLSPHYPQYQSVVEVARNEAIRKEAAEL